MQGLLGLDPITMGLLAAGGGMLSASGPSRMPQSLGGIAGQGLLTGLNAYSGALDQNRKFAQTNQIIDLQKQQMRMTEEQIKSAQRQAAIDEAMFSPFLGRQGVSPGGMAPSAPNAAAGGSAEGMSPNTSMLAFGSPEFASQPSPQSLPQRSPINPALLDPNFIGMAQMRGKNLVDLHKHLTTPEKMEPGAQYRDRVTGETRYLPRLPEGAVLSPQGQVSPAPGMTDTIGALTGAQERAKAGMQIGTLNMPGGGTQQIPVDLMSDLLRKIHGVPQGGTVSGTAPTPAAAITNVGAAAANGRQGSFNVGPIGFQQPEAVRAGDKVTAEGQAKSFVERSQALRQAWGDAQAMRSGLDMMEHLASNPNVASGKLAEEISGLKSLAESFGIKTKGLAAEEAIKSIATEMALKAKNQGGTNLMPGAMAVFEQKMLQSMTPQLAQSAEGRMLMIQVFKAKAERDQRISEMAVDYEDKHGKLDNGFEREVRQFVKANPMFDEAGAKAIEDRAKAILNPSLAKPGSGTTQTIHWNKLGNPQR